MKRRRIPAHKLQYIPKGREAVAYQAGDFILTHNATNWMSWLIRFGQSLRFTGKDKKYCYWNHTALIIDNFGDIIEAQQRGIVKAHLSKYTQNEYVVVRTEATDADRRQVVALAEHALGEPYGIVTFISIGLSLLTGLRFSFGFEGQLVCSGLVAKALERTDAIFDRSSTHIVPADLARYYKVEIPQ